MEVLATVSEDCDVRVSVLGVEVPVNWSPRVMPGRKVVCGDSDAADALWTTMWHVNVRVGELDSAEDGLTLSFRYTFKLHSG